ncbi:MAG: hypothetical protein OIF32_02975 [Campylobacterales bacterium]|nr:hypothetical protein [Campylobacterales bacterium]
MEPSMNDIDDFNGNESPEKKKTVSLVIISLVGIIAVLQIVKMWFDVTATP